MGYFEKLLKPKQERNKRETEELKEIEEEEKGPTWKEVEDGLKKMKQGKEQGTGKTCVPQPTLKNWAELPPSKDTPKEHSRSLLPPLIGATIPVWEGVEFVELYVDLILNKGVHKHYKAFHEGFHKVCGGRVLELFHAHELMAVVVGSSSSSDTSTQYSSSMDSRFSSLRSSSSCVCRSAETYSSSISVNPTMSNENYNWEEFENNAEYRNGYTATDPTIIMFWEVFHELSLEDKKKFLLYLTGSDRIPIQGMKAIKIIDLRSNFTLLYGTLFSLHITVSALLQHPRPITVSTLLQHPRPITVSALLQHPHPVPIKP
uniref:HECT-type E3 ubiquitin transferase n=1 Tax=Timema douglasi TaxID=61478 RepID=A0A7R8VV62_TIMDO|nr:unnamed protein product [Timema douglasi]